MRSLREKKAEYATKETAISADAVQTGGELGTVLPGQTSEGDTASTQAGEVAKAAKGKEQDEAPPWLKERLGREKERREKLSADLSAAQLESQKIRHLFDVAVAENERLTEALRQGQTFDERGEELQALRVQQQAKEMLDRLRAEHEQTFQAQLREQHVSQIADQLRSEISSACGEFQLVSPAEVRSELRKNAGADVREVAKAIHEQRLTFLQKQNSQKQAAAIPTTVAKPTGTSGFNYALDRKGMTQAFRAARAKA